MIEPKAVQCNALLNSVHDTSCAKRDRDFIIVERNEI
jgi:hypothetical protein